MHMQSSNHAHNSNPELLATGNNEMVTPETGPGGGHSDVADQQVRPGVILSCTPQGPYSIILHVNLTAVHLKYNFLS